MDNNSGLIVYTDVFIQEVYISVRLLDLGNSRLCLCLHEEVCELLEWRLAEYSLLPQVRGQVAVSLGNGSICGLCWNTKETMLGFNCNKRAVYDSSLALEFVS